WYQAGGTSAWYYAVFWSGMPDLNWRNPAVRAEMDAIAGRWLARGVDGFRLDAVRYLIEDGAGLQEDRPETHTCLGNWTAGVLATNPHARIVGESWADCQTISTYFGAPAAGGLPLLFNFPLADAVVSGVAAGSARTIAAMLDTVARTYPAGSADAPFLTNHDQERVASRLGGDPSRLKLAASILLTLQGTPMIYYGEEIGMRNGSCSSDECKRTPMAWDGTAGAGFTAGTAWWPLSPGTSGTNVASQTGDPSSLLSRYRDLIRVRKASPALSRGGTARLPAEDANIPAWPACPARRRSNVAVRAQRRPARGSRGEIRGAEDVDRLAFHDLRRRSGRHRDRDAEFTSPSPDNGRAGGGPARDLREAAGDE